MKTRSIHNIGFLVLGEFPSKHFPLTNTIKKSLSRAQMRISHIIYISSMTFWTIVATAIAAASAFPLTHLLNSALRLNLSALQLLYVPLGAAVGVGAITFAVFLFYPGFLAGTIKTGIDKNIVYITSYMQILAGAGVTVEDIFSSLAVSGDTYKIEGSAKSIVRDVETLGKDIISAVVDESQNTPSLEYSKLLAGLIGTTRSGGDLRVYLGKESEHEMQVRRRNLTKLVGQLNLAAEVYIVLGIAFPVILTTLLSLMGAFGGDIIAGLGPIQLMNLMIYIFFPLSSIGVLLLIDGMSSSW